MQQMLPRFTLLLFVTVLLIFVEMRGRDRPGKSGRNPGANHSLSRVWRKGQKMKKLVLSILAAAALATPALAADVRLVTKAPPPPPSPWDIAFGAALMSDYLVRGITQSNHRPSVFAYFEPRYNINQGPAALRRHRRHEHAFPTARPPRSTSTPASRPTFGPLALDFGAMYYWYPRMMPASTAPVSGRRACQGYLPVNFNVAKADASFWEVYARASAPSTTSSRSECAYSITRIAC